jgi:hypothetical protein
VVITTNKPYKNKPGNKTSKNVIPQPPSFTSLSTRAFYLKKRNFRSSRAIYFC